MYNINRYSQLILEHKFFEAHEVLELFWFPRRKEKGKEVLIIKGFINAAVAFELKKRERVTPSLKVWQTYKKFSNYIDKSDIELYQLKVFIDKFANEYLDL